MKKVAKVLKVAQTKLIDMKILHVTDITQRFQTTVPKLVREILNINNAEDRIVWILDNEEIKVKKA